MKNIIVIIIIALSSFGNAQVGISAGTSMLLPFKQGVKPYAGFHLGVEIPRDDQMSIYGRYTHHFSQEASFTYNLFATPININDGLPFISVESIPSMNYNLLEGGARYYLGDGFDYGWAGYGGTNVMLILNKVRGNYEDFDESLYQIDLAQRLDGSIFGLGAGLGGGVEYSDARIGTFYFDLNLNYIVFAYPSSANIYTSLYSPLIFNFNLGYRRDFNW